MAAQGKILQDFERRDMICYWSQCTSIIYVVSDSFVDYAGKTHHFVIAAVSKMLPKDTNQLDQLVDEDPQEVYYDVDIVVDGDGTVDTLCSVTKALYMGISICLGCNPKKDKKVKKKNLKK